jgi:hypothetical protein
LVSIVISQLCACPRWVAKIPPSVRTDSHLDHNSDPTLKEPNAMFTPRLIKPAVRTALAVGTLGLAALLTAGTASAEAADAQFLGALQQQGIGFGDTQSAITVAHHTCDALSHGMTPSDISNKLAGANARIDRQTAVLIVVDAAQACCPQYVHQMANGATVVGPAR